VVTDNLVTGVPLGVLVLGVLACVVAAAFVPVIGLTTPSGRGQP